MIFTEAIKSFHKTKVFSWIIVLQFTISFMVVNTLLYNIQSMKQSSERYSSHFSDKSRYELSDDLENGQLKYFTKNNSDLNRLKTFYDELVSEQGYTFLETIVQPIYIQNFSGSDIFKYGYEDGYDISNFEHNGKLYSSVKSIFLNEDAWKEYGLKVTQGRSLSTNDFVLAGNKLPAVLGYEYMSYYAVGDILEINHYGKNFSMEIIGFLAQDSAILRRGGHITYLDRYIVLPAVTCPNDPISEEDRQFQGINYIEKVNGTVVLNNGYGLGQFISTLEDLRRKHDIFNFSVWGVTNWEVKLLKITSERSIHLMTLLGWMMITFSIISLSVIMTCKLHKNRQEYAIHLMCGGSMWNIATYVLAECLIIFATSHLLSFLITTLLFGRVIQYSIYWVAISTITILLASIQPLVYLSKLDISTLLRRKD